MDQQEQSRWGKPLLWTAGFVAVLVFLTIVICSYLFGWKWTGLPKQTLWDWLDLLIVPAVLAVGGYLFTRSENRSTQAAAERRALDDILQAYLDGMSQLLTNRDQPLHSAQPGDSLSTVARARTLTVLGRLDGGRKRSVLQFLYESELIDKERTLLNEANLIEKQHNIVSLGGADLGGAILRRVNLSGADLSGAILRRADLSGARGWTEDQLGEANTLKGAIMPDGQTLKSANNPDEPTFKDWLKDKEGRKEAGENE